ncbi:MAG: helicase, partial [bacterium]|nr:helicase [bacterium]
GKINTEYKESLLTYFRRGKLEKFFIIKVNEKPKELDFLSAAKLMESDLEEKKQKLPEAFYNLLDMNKEAFIFSTTEEMAEPHFKGKGGRDSATNILKVLKLTLKNTRQLTDEQELYLRKVVKQLEEGGLPKQTTKEVLKALDELKQDVMNPLKVLATLQTRIPGRLLEGHFVEYSPVVFGKREVILSLYFSGE